MRFWFFKWRTLAVRRLFLINVKFIGFQDCSNEFLGCSGYKQGVYATIQWYYSFDSNKLNFWNWSKDLWTHVGFIQLPDSRNVPCKLEAVSLECSFTWGKAAWLRRTCLVFQYVLHSNGDWGNKSNIKVDRWSTQCRASLERFSKFSSAFEKGSSLDQRHTKRTKSDWNMCVLTQWVSTPKMGGPACMKITQKQVLR